MKSIGVLTNVVFHHAVKVQEKRRNRFAVFFKLSKENLNVPPVETSFPDYSPQEDITWDCYGKLVFKNDLLDTINT